MQFDYREYIKRNPWEVVNLSSVGTACGRFPTRERAEEHARTYRGGIVSVDDKTRRVYVAETPSL